jgi:hypothetical protein
VLNFPELHCLSWGVDFSVSAVVALMYVEFSGGRGSSGSCGVTYVVANEVVNLEIVRLLLLLLGLGFRVLIWYSGVVAVAVECSTVLYGLLSCSSLVLARVHILGTM